MDCYKILEIEKTNDEKIIKKAYSKLLKVYSPEKDPEGFQKLRKENIKQLLIICICFMVVFGIMSLDKSVLNRTASIKNEISKITSDSEKDKNTLGSYRGIIYKLTFKLLNIVKFLNSTLSILTIVSLLITIRYIIPFSYIISYRRLSIF